MLWLMYLYIYILGFFTTYLASKLVDSQKICSATIYLRYLMRGVFFGTFGKILDLILVITQKQ